MEDEDEGIEDEVDGTDEDVCGVAVSMTSPVEAELAEGYRYSMSPCLDTDERLMINTHVWP